MIRNLFKVWYRKTFKIFLRFVCQTTLTISVPYANFYQKSILNNFSKVPVPIFS